MNFKIESNFLDMTNYPSIERHFEKRAKDGWLISKIIAGTLFIYRSIEPQALDFSITPYEIENAFNRRTKNEIKEFQSVSETVGWHYQTQGSDLHIYYKKEDAKAIPIQTNDEDEFLILESIGKKTLNSYWVFLVILLIGSFFISKGIFASSHSMKNGGHQIAAMILPLGIILTIWGIIQTYRFLKINRENLEVGKTLEFSQSNFYFARIISTLIYFLSFLFLIYAFYLGFFLKNVRFMVSFIPLVIGLTVGNIYRWTVKRQKRSTHYKKIVFGIILLGAIVISSGINLDRFSKWIEGSVEKDLNDYNVLTSTDFDDIELIEEGPLMDQTSFLVPKSYEHYFFITLNEEEGKAISTEYGQALTEDLADILVKSYKEAAVMAVSGEYSDEILVYLHQGYFDEAILKTGLTKTDLKALRELDFDEAEKLAQKMIVERSIIPANEESWNADEVYYLNYEKTTILIKKDKEVIYLSGRDFSKLKNIEIAKEKLALND